MIRLMLVPLLLASMGACGTPKEGLTVGVADLPDGSPLPARFGEDGGDTSPALAWSGAPAQTRAFALIVDDPDAPGGTWTHWVVYDLPVSKGLDEGRPRGTELPGGGKQGLNSWGRLGWNGPAPPPGKVHHYVFRVFALSAPTGLAPGASVDTLRLAMKGRVLAEGRWTGTYRR
ncbi:MAG TPA: YbhB/YbcL family Raf kinase inhibitor-like protein [Holophagaceae bacterium]|jgi:Raf kinase inhibitor-like YbhB/YbcL family protein|nr:YbhB/YbcL family Raf kinase inhibitor-like protein [Holophagaceae bacterium]